MPSRNITREFAEDQYYHLYNRGVEKRDIFIDEQDYIVFLGLLKKYLSGQDERRLNRHKFDSLADKVELLAYCLMPNHYHLLIHQKDKEATTKLMRRVMTGYVMYFNDRYQRVGVLFQGRYKASLINSDAYLHHISRYIHMNPDEYKTWPYSSYRHYINPANSPAWLNTHTVLKLFNNDIAEYKEFIEDYKFTKDELAVLKWQLANDLDM